MYYVTSAHMLDVWIFTLCREAGQQHHPPTQAASSTGLGRKKWKENEEKRMRNRERRGGCGLALASACTVRRESREWVQPKRPRQLTSGPVHMVVVFSLCKSSTTTRCSLPSSISVHFFLLCTQTWSYHNPPPPPKNPEPLSHQQSKVNHVENVTWGGYRNVNGETLHSIHLSFTLSSSLKCNFARLNPQ